MPTGSRPAKYEHNTLGSGSGTQSPFPRDDKTMDIDQPNDASSLVVDVLQRVGEICLMDGQHRSMINLALGCKRLKERLTMEIEEGEGLYSVMWDYELQHYTPAQMKLARTLYCTRDGNSQDRDFFNGIRRATNIESLHITNRRLEEYPPFNDWTFPLERKTRFKSLRTLHLITPLRSNCAEIPLRDPMVSLPEEAGERAPPGQSSDRRGLHFPNLEAVHLELIPNRFHPTSLTLALNSTSLIPPETSSSSSKDTFLQRVPLLMQHYWRVPNLTIGLRIPAMEDHEYYGGKIGWRRLSLRVEAKMRRGDMERVVIIVEDWNQLRVRFGHPLEPVQTIQDRALAFVEKSWFNLTSLKITLTSGCLQRGLKHYPVLFLKAFLPSDAEFEAWQKGAMAKHPQLNEIELSCRIRGCLLSPNKEEDEEILSWTSSRNDPVHFSFGQGSTIHRTSEPVSLARHSEAEVCPRAEMEQEKKEKKEKKGSDGGEPDADDEDETDEEDRPYWEVWNSERLEEESDTSGRDTSSEMDID